MDKDQALNAGVGTEVSQKLTAKPVKIVSVDITTKDFSGKPSDQLVVMCRHPDKPEPFQMYNVSYKKGQVIKTVGLTLYWDSKGQIMQGTGPAELLRLNNVAKLKDLEDKEIPTEVSSKGFLAFKAY